MNYNPRSVTDVLTAPPPGYHQRRTLDRFVAGGDLFSRQFDGSTLAGHFREAGFHLVPANTNRVEGWSEMLHGFGDPDRGFRPTLYIHKNCQLLLRTLPYLQHDPDHPADILKTNVNDEGEGGDDAADAARYLIATKARTIVQRKLRGL